MSNVYSSPCKTVVHPQSRDLLRNFFLKIFSFQKLEFPPGCEFPASIRTTGDLVSLFNTKDGLIGLSPAETKMAVELLITHYSSLTVPLPGTVVLNLVTALTASPTLLDELPGPHVKSALTTVAVDHRVLLGVPKTDLVLFFRRLLTMPAHRIAYCVPKPVFVAIVGTVSSCPDLLHGVPVSDVTNLITVMSLSKSWFQCLPPPFVLALLNCIATRPVMPKLTPSTLFGFVEGLFETLGDSSYFLADTVPTTTLFAIVNPLLTRQMLSVFPVRNFDLLLSVLGSSPALARALPASRVANVFAILSTSPRILTSLNPSRVGNAIMTVVTSKNATDGITARTWDNLFESIFHYLPECLEYINCNANQEVPSCSRENKLQ